MVVINTSIYPELGERLAKTLSDQGSLDLRLVAIVEPGDSNQIDVLSETGFDAVLAKPFHRSELESLLAS
jgi:AmiR/NasT family two-component response regulator